MSEKRTPSRAMVISTIAFLSLVTAFCIDTIADFWPAIGVQADACARLQSGELSPAETYSESLRKAYKIACGAGPIPITRVNLQGGRAALSPDQALLGVIALFAIAGALLRSLYSLAYPALTGGEITSSIGWTWARLIVAAALAFVVYTILRAIFNPAGNVGSIQPYPYLAVAALIGVFIDELLAIPRRLLGRAKS